MKFIRLLLFLVGFLVLAAPLQVIRLAAYAQVVISGTATTNGGWSAPIQNPLVSITVTGPSSVQINQSGQYTATGTYATGSTANLTTTSVWSSGSPAVATIGTLTSTQGVNCIAAPNTSMI